MKKILAIAPYQYLPFFSGGQKFIANFFGWLATKNDLEVVSVPGNEVYLANNYELVPLLKPGKSRYFDRSLINAITKRVHAANTEVIICEHPYLAWVAFAVKRKTGVPVFIHSHNIESQRFRSLGKWWWPLLALYEKWSFRKADGIFFITGDDKQFAIDRWKINRDKCIDLPFGIDIDQHPQDRSACKISVANELGISPNETFLLFNGLLNYSPNIDAVKHIIEDINPILKNYEGFNYKIVICGKGLPDTFLQLPEEQRSNIIFTGFVKDIDRYIKAADVFLNPVLSGGGVKTKIVEAIAQGTTVVSSVTGSIGLAAQESGEKLVIVPDGDWNAFAKQVLSQAGNINATPHSFYEHYYWGNIIGRINLLTALN